MTLATVMGCVPVIALVVAHSVAAAGSAAPRPNLRLETVQFGTWKSTALRALGAREDANSLATAAALSFTRSGNKVAVPPSAPAALELASRASELAPQNVGISWLHVSLCADTPSCDIRDVATVMRWVDADNSAAWLPTLAAAQRDKDTMEVDRVLADMARGTHFDFYWNQIVVLMVDALDAVRNALPNAYATSDFTRLATVTGIASGEIIPNFQPLMVACRESMTLPERRELCMKLSKIMQRSDTIVAQMMGYTIEKRLVAPDGKEARALAERKRVLEWREAESGKFDTPLLPWLKNARARARLAQMRAKAREEDVCIAILRQHKMTLDPPEAHP